MRMSASEMLLARTKSLCPGLIIRDDPIAVGDYIANYICKRYE